MFIFDIYFNAPGFLSLLFRGWGRCVTHPFSPPGTKKGRQYKRPDGCYSLAFAGLELAEMGAQIKAHSVCSKLVIKSPCIPALMPVN